MMSTRHGIHRADYGDETVYSDSWVECRKDKQDPLNPEYTCETIGGEYYNCYNMKPPYTMPRCEQKYRKMKKRYHKLF